jgi:cytochrome P450
MEFPFRTPPSADVDEAALAALAVGPLARADTADGTVWLALSHQAARQVLSDPRFSRAALARTGTDRPVVLKAAYRARVLSNQDPPEHTATRRLVAGAFGPRATAELAPRVRRLVGGLLDRIAAPGPPADLVPLLTEPLPVAVICAVLGFPAADRDRIRGWARRLVASIEYPPQEVDAAGRELRGYLSGQIAAKRAAPGPDVGSELVRLADEQGAFSPAELAANLQMLLVVGHETTIDQLGTAVLALLRHPDQLALLRRRPELLDAAVEELLRYARVTSVSLPRVALSTVDVCGRRIEAGELVVAVSGAANMDPAEYADPRRLDIAREHPAPHLAFGHGPHYCLGAHLARLELRTVLAALLDRFPGLALAGGDAEPAWHPGTGMRALRCLPVTW